MLHLFSKESLFQKSHEKDLLSKKLKNNHVLIGHTDFPASVIEFSKSYLIVAGIIIQSLITIGQFLEA